MRRTTEATTEAATDTILLIKGEIMADKIMGDTDNREEIPEIELLRIQQTEEAIYGILRDKIQPFAVTLELPWRDNCRDKSCIPHGVYFADLSPPTERIRYAHYVLSGVPERDGIAIHRANFPVELKGCIAIGKSFGESSIEDSLGAFLGFMKRMNNEKKIKINIIPKFFCVSYPILHDGGDITQGRGKWQIEL